MARPWAQKVAAAAPAGAQAWYAADFMQSPFDATYALSGLTGGVTGTYTVEYTLDNVNEVASPEVFTVVSSATVDTTGAIPFCRFARVNFGTGPVGGPATFTILQGMSSR